MTGQRTGQSTTPLPVPAGLAWLGIVRHGQSLANALSRQAGDAGRALTGVTERDADVPLTEQGQQEARRAGAWLGSLPAESCPDLIVVSPYLRCQETARLALAAAHQIRGTPLRARVVTDERLRDNEVGILEGLTAHGIVEHHPAEAERKVKLGPFYYRPPGGESWTDVALRLRSLLTDLNAGWPDRRVLWVAHDLTARLGRYLLEGLTEAELLDSARSEPVPNASLTAWARRDGCYRAAERYSIEHLAPR